MRNEKAVLEKSFSQQSNELKLRDEELTQKISLLLELRKEPPSEQRDEKIKDKYKEIIRDYGTKAKDVNEKYISSPISTDFASVYVPSESLYLELSTHITEKKELWISEIQKKYKVTFMGPSTFSAYCGAILLGFKTISVDKRSQNFLKHLD